MTDAKLTATLKAGTTFDAPWIVVYGDTAGEINARLDELAQLGTATRVANAAKELQATYSAAALGSVQQVSSQQEAPIQFPQNTQVTGAAYQPPQQEQQAPAGGRTCQHGARVRREGVSARGPWVGWFCSTPKGTPGQCPADFKP